MTFAHVVLKDKTDLTPEVSAALPGAHILGTYERPSFDPDAITILSVKHSSVGRTVLNRYRNLQTVIVRAHGVDTIDQNACAARGIRVLHTSPHTDACARWLHHYTPTTSQHVVLFGGGQIGRAYMQLVPAQCVTRQTSLAERQTLLRDADTLILTLPLTSTTRHYVNAELFGELTRPVHLVSLSRGDVIDTDAVFDAIRDGRILSAHFDMVSPHRRDDLLASPQVHYHHHTAWSFTTPDPIRYADTLRRLVIDASHAVAHVMTLDV